MNESDVKKYWEENAETWTILSRKGYDVCRDHLNTPAFLRMLPDVKGLEGLDVGCGEGHNTRIITEKGALMTGIDISEKFIKHAHQKENKDPLNIKYLVGSGLNLPFGNNIFDFCISTMALMDMANYYKAVQEIHRVLKKGGFFQFSISHPCFLTPIAEWIYNKKGEKVALACGDYFKRMNGEVEEWIFSSIPEELKNKYKKFKIARFSHTLSSWLNLLINTGFILEEFDEPYPDDEKIKKFPQLADCKIIPYFLTIRCKKP